jgi:hypothetical protein
LSNLTQIPEIIKVGTRGSPSLIFAPDRANSFHRQREARAVILGFPHAPWHSQSWLCGTIVTTPEDASKQFFAPIQAITSLVERSAFPGT